MTRRCSIRPSDADAKFNRDVVKTAAGRTAAGSSRTETDRTTKQNQNNKDDKDQLRTSKAKRIRRSRRVSRTQTESAAESTGPAESTQSTQPADAAEPARSAARRTDQTRVRLSAPARVPSKVMPPRRTLASQISCHALEAEQMLDSVKGEERHWRRQRATASPKTPLHRSGLVDEVCGATSGECAVGADFVLLALAAGPAEPPHGTR